MNETLLFPKAAFTIVLIAGGAGAIAARGALLTEAPLRLEIQTPNQAYLKDEDEPILLPLSLSGQLDGPDVASQNLVRSPERTYPVRRGYGRNGQIGNRTRGDIRTIR